MEILKILRLEVVGTMFFIAAVVSSAIIFIPHVLGPERMGWISASILVWSLIFFVLSDELVGEVKRTKVFVWIVVILLISLMILMMLALEKLVPLF